MEERTMEDVRGLLNGLEIECEIEGHDTKPWHDGPAKFICYLRCPSCGYSETATLCAPIARKMQAAGAAGKMFTMSPCCGGRYRLDAMNTWEKL